MTSPTARSRKGARPTGAGRRSPQASERRGAQRVALQLSPSTERRRILLAEDDTDMRELLAWALLDAGYDVDAAPDGADLCNRLARHLLHTDSRPVDLVISDIRMPGYSGLDVIKGLRNVDRLPPTILITAFGDEENHRQAEEIGVLLLDKPFEIDELLARVREVLGS